MTDKKLDLFIENERSISDKVSETIRRAIISQVLSPDERLVEAKIAKTLNVSITPVRHAFAQLANEGLLVVYPFKGTYVIKVTKKFIDDVLFVRKNLESAAASLAFENISEDDCKTLLLYCEKSERLFFEEKNIYESVKYDVAFHTIFFEKSNNGPLLEMWNMLKNRIQYIQSYTKSDSMPKNHILSRHMEIIDAIRKGDKELLIQSLQRHIETSRVYANADIL